MPAITMELSQTQHHNTGSNFSKSKSQEHLQKALSPSQPQYKRPVKSSYKHQHQADIHKVDTSGVFTRSWETFPSHLQNGQQPAQNFPMNVPFQQQQQPQHFNQPLVTPVVQQAAPVPLVSSDQQANRQAMLEQLRIQEQQQLAKLMAPKPEIVSQPKPAFTIPPVQPVDDKTKAHHHHDLLRQHNEEYRVLQAKKSAAQMANMRYGYYSSHDSNHFNFIVPIIPSVQALNSESSAPTEKNENTVS